MHVSQWKETTHLVAHWIALSLDRRRIALYLTYELCEQRAKLTDCSSFSATICAFAVFQILIHLCSNRWTAIMLGGRRLSVSSDVDPSEVLLEFSWLPIRRHVFFEGVQPRTGGFSRRSEREVRENSVKHGFLLHPSRRATAASRIGMRSIINTCC